jgi:two-component system response regulator CpxR
MRPRILVIDDDRELAAMLAEFLGHEGFDITLREDAHGDEPVIVGEVPDLVVLDVMLPGRNGFALLKELRTQWPRLPIIMLTARGDAIDRILGLELGADDYLAKPFDPRELAARLRAVLRRASAAGESTGTPEPGSSPLGAGQLQLDPQRRRAEAHGIPLDLTGAEWRVLVCLIRGKGSLVERAELTEQALGRRLTAYDRSVDTHVNNLRRKLERAGGCGIEIRAVRGAGYELLETGNT